MGLGFGTSRRAALVLVLAGLSVGAVGQSVTLTEPSMPLLPAKFGGWTRTETAGAAPVYALANLSPQALAECGEQRSKVAEYTHGGRLVHVEAIEFGDKTGAYSAFTLAERPGMTVGSELGVYDAVGSSSERSAEGRTGNGGGVVLFLAGKAVVLANFVGGAAGTGGTAADVRTLRPLAEAMPKVFGNSGLAPMLPMLTPTKGLVPGSIRYALGPVSYAAEGGVLPPGSLDWKMEVEAVTAQYDDSRGRETLTLLLFPTPTIAESAAKVIRSKVPELKGSARLQQRGTLVALATGSFAGDAAAQMVGGVHLTVMTFNQDVHPAFKVVAAQTFTLLENIAVLSGVLCSGAVLLGLFLGFGRAWFRVLRGKPAAVEVEFLSLHLSPQNKPAVFQGPDPREGFG
ncbi:MAG: DUF6599 family protein, partial [Acidobacteriaceae bacterium]